MSKVRWNNGRVEYQFLGEWNSMPRDTTHLAPSLRAALDAWAAAHPEPLGKDQWRAPNGDVWTFHRDAETKMPRAVDPSGGGWPFTGSGSPVQSALLAWARENPAEREGSVVGDHGISLKVKWVGDRLTCGTITKDVDEHLLSDLLWVDSLRSALRAWIARTRPEMLPEEAEEVEKVEPWSIVVTKYSGEPGALPARFRGKRVRVTVEVIE